MFMVEYFRDGTLKYGAKESIFFRRKASNFGRIAAITRTPWAMNDGLFCRSFCIIVGKNAFDHG